MIARKEVELTSYEPNSYCMRDSTARYFGIKKARQVNMERSGELERRKLEKKAYGLQSQAQHLLKRCYRWNDLARALYDLTKRTVPEKDTDVLEQWISQATTYLDVVTEEIKQREAVEIEQREAEAKRKAEAKLDDERQQREKKRQEQREWEMEVKTSHFDHIHVAWAARYKSSRCYKQEGRGRVSGDRQNRSKMLARIRRSRKDLA